MNFWRSCHPSSDSFLWTPATISDQVTTKMLFSDPIRKDSWIQVLTLRHPYLPRLTSKVPFSCSDPSVLFPKSLALPLRKSLSSPSLSSLLFLFHSPNDHVLIVFKVIQFLLLTGTNLVLPPWPANPFLGLTYNIRPSCPCVIHGQQQWHAQSSLDSQLTGVCPSY